MKYFTISEFLYSPSAVQQRIWNGASRQQEDNIITLVEKVLDPLRQHYGKPISITSGFRCPKLNAVMPNASKSSQHLFGEAADICSNDGPIGNYALGQLIVQLGHFDQVIFEDVPMDSLLPLWIHVSWRHNGSNRQEIRKHVIGTGNVYPIVSRKELGL